ncbi:MAG: alpha-glucan family phosphorylase, partial [Melioribacteraceae bacterium]|nr:alpha-glucan family phosphorylase [Melioribacteraceae bacterium]
AMNMAGYVNGVSKLHGEVSKKMWVAGFKDVPFDEIPIDYVTNGIHVRTHISGDMNELLFRYLGENFIYAPEETETWNRVDEIPDEELWRTHERRRERLVAFARKRLRQQIIQRGGSASEIAAAKEALDPSVLTIGFARRFATYKRATLILQDIERLVSILCDSRTPVQLIIAGKAHPRDEEGKKLIQELIAVAKEDHLRKKIVFIENYDMNVARYMVEGCDVWLNNPRRPLEASGTSGMKIIANGGLNFSVLDGWWDEGYDPEVGWKIGSGEEYNDLDYQDEVESRLIYETLEKEIIPLFYNRGDDKLPRGWIQMMKNSMKKLAPLYNTNRMVQQYTEKFYLKAYDNRALLMNNEWKKGKEFSDWKQRVISSWNTIKFINVSQEHSNGDLKIGDEFVVNAEVNLGGLKPSDVMVQIYYGKIDDKDLAHVNKFTEMDTSGKLNKNGNYIYRGKIICENSGQFGYTLRMMPKHEVQVNQFDLGLIKWVDNKIS